MTTVVAMLRPSASVLAAIGPDLANALRLRALALSTAGRYDEALIDVEEALRICRRATIVRRTTAEVEFAAALSVRAHVLRCSGRERGRWTTHGKRSPCAGGGCPALHIGSAPFC
ncbi:hypothetical protein ACFXPR_21500 [Nocardia tengchongensis]|uniref:hypothetical protein n=1 Tax=Nocardia tengchongensis TaxID=2055889 RepID=UPI0036816F5B